MWLDQSPIFCLFLVITNVRMVKLEALGMCRRFSSAEQQQAHVLRGHVISTKAANSFEDCAGFCVEKTSCHSVNYYNKRKKCELNDWTAQVNPGNLVQDLDGSYLDIHRPYTACKDSYCKQDETCKMDKDGNIRCEVCSKPLGMESGTIKDFQINASSVWSHASHLQPEAGRLNNPSGFWAPSQSRVDEWLQIAFNQTMIVTKVATQGRGPSYPHWVTSYNILFGKDAAWWEVYKENGQDKVFSGNTNATTVVSHVLSPKIRHARYVRFLVKSWRTAIAMRVELYGCKE